MRRLFSTIQQAIIILFVSGCAVPKVNAEEPKELRIGVMVALSGNWASLGKMTQMGLTLAQKEINTRGGVLGRKIEFDVQDTDEAESGAKVVSAYRYLRAKKINLIIGPTGSPGGLAVAPVAAKEDVLVISPSVGVKGFHLAGNNLFNTQGVWEKASRLLARSAYEEGVRKAAIFSSQHPFESEQADAFKDEFVKAGGAITARVDPLPDKTDLAAEALLLVKSKPDAVFYANYNQMALSAKAMKTLGFRGKQYAATIDSSRLVGASGALHGAVFSRLSGDSAAFAAKFKKAFGEQPSYPADYAYDALISLVKGIESARTIDPALVKSKLISVSFDGASGPVSFDALGCIVRKPTKWKVKGETFESLGDLK